MTRVLVVSDRPLTVAGLCRQLECDRTLAVDAGAPRGRHAFEPAAALRPDVVLIDCDGGAGGFLLCHALKQLARPQRAVAHLTRATPRLEVAAWVAGADGLAVATTPAPRLAEIVRCAAAGQRRLPRPRIYAVRSAGEQLSATDLAIFGMRMYDVPSHEISQALRLDPLEVDRRVRSLVERLGGDDHAPTTDARPSGLGSASPARARARGAPPGLSSLSGSIATMGRCASS